MRALTAALTLAFGFILTGPAGAASRAPEALLAAAPAVLATGTCLDLSRAERACFWGAWFQDGRRLTARPASGPYEAVDLTVRAVGADRDGSELVVTHERWSGTEDDRTVDQTFVFLRGPRAGQADHQTLAFAGTRLAGSASRPATAAERDRALQAALALLSPEAASPAPAAPRSDDPERPCLPPGIPADAFLWPVVEVERLTLDGARGPQRALAIHYRRASASMIAVWVGPRLVVVDDHPESPDPAWIDTAVMDPSSGMLRAHPAPACAWRRLRPGHPLPGEAT